MLKKKESDAYLKYWKINIVIRRRTSETELKMK